MSTVFLDQFQIELPIIQAPMAGVSTPALAAAVCNAGGLGSVAIGALTVPSARVAIETTRALTDRPFNVNVFCHAPAILNPAISAAWLDKMAPLFERFGATPPDTLQEIYRSFNDNEAMLQLLLELRPAVVSFHFGLPPRSMIEALKQAGILLMAATASLDEARQIEQAGLDAVVAQGVEAGGHRANFEPGPAGERGFSTTVLTRRLVQNISLPVIAAGGIMDGAGIQAALTLGAQAVQLGTAFIACPESAADANYRAALHSARAEHTLLTAAISGRLARGLSNGLTDLLGQEAFSSIPVYPYAYDAAKALQTAARATGSSEFDTRWAGQGAPLSRALPAAELVRQLCAEMAQSLAYQATAL